MMPRELPARPNLEQLKKQAKSLLHAAQAHDGDALRRFAALPAFSGKPINEINAADLALHDAQSLIAREYGFPSWPALREEVEARTLSFGAALDEFVRCATGGASGRAERLLALYPDVASANLYAALVLGDAASVDARLRDHPELTKQPGGPQNWEPLLYVCHSCMHVAAPSRVDGFVAIARQLCSLGANPNAEYHWNWHPELPRTALWGSICAVGHLPLAEVLLKAGANPTDGVSMHIAGGGGNTAALDLLHRYGVKMNGIQDEVPPLVYMMLWADNPAGPNWLLEHGADPNLAWGEAGEAPLHVAARRWDVPMVERLLRNGADVLRHRADGATAHTLAELHGNTDIAACRLRTGRTTNCLRSTVLQLPVLARIAWARRACLQNSPACERSCGLSTTSCFIARLKAATLRCWKRCSPAASIRRRRTKTVSRHCTARRWAVTPTQCGCCYNTARTSMRRTECSLRRRWFGRSRADVPRSTPE
jgi:ankyrin repeat protein